MVIATQPQLEAFSKIAAMLETVIFNGSTGGSDREFYTIPHPGIFIDPTLSDRPNSVDMELTSTLFNGCFNATLLYNPLLTSVSQTYSDALDQAALPDKKLTAQEKKKLKDLEDDLVLLIDGYLKYKQRHDDVKGEIVRAQANSEPVDVIARLQAKLQAALSEWKLRGRKDRFEQTEAEVAYLRSVSPRQHFQNLKSRFDQHTQTSGVSNYQATYLSPPIMEWNSPYAGWAQFEKTFKYSELHTYSKHTSWSGSAGANFGVWKIGGSAGGSSADIHEASENTDIELKFEFLRVRVLRPWLVSDLFRYRFWTYKSAFGYRLVSEGYTPGTITPVGPTGLMPVLPTDIVLARNVTISANFSASERKFAQDTINGSVGGGWGPFRARGSYQSTTTKEDVVGSFDGTTLRIANPQIIAMMGILLPKTPDPDRRLPFGPDADFGDTADTLKAASAHRNTGILSSSEYDTLARQQTAALGGLQWRDT